MGEGDSPEECRFLLNTQLVFLKKEKDPTTKQFDDDEWIRSLTEAQEITTDVPEDSTVYDQQVVDPINVRPIQMGEFLRKYVSRRLLALSEGEIAALTTSMRQHGVGTPGGAEALAIFHQLLYDEWMTGSLSGPLATIQVDEKNCFGMIEWKAVRPVSFPSTLQWRDGNIGTCPTLNRRRCCQCPRIAVQIKETSVAPGVQLSSGIGGG